jgi:hypothetical protein
MKKSIIDEGRVTECRVSTWLKISTGKAFEV